MRARQHGQTSYPMLQSTEALKRVLGLPSALNGELPIMDSLPFETRRITRRKDVACPLRGPHRTIRALTQPARRPFEHDPADLTLAELSAFRVVDLREPEERIEAALSQALEAPFSNCDSSSPPFDGSKLVLLACARGRHVEIVAQKLRALGWNDVFSLTGGAASLASILRPAAE